MPSSRLVLLAAIFLPWLPAPPLHAQQQPATPPLPEMHQLMREVMDHQKQLDKVRETYTYSSLQTTQDIDGNGQVKKTESEEGEDFFVNGHLIERTVKKNGQPLNEHDQQKETQRVTKEVEKAEKTPPGQPLQGPSVSVSRVLEVMDLHNERRESYRGRPTIVFDFVGRKETAGHHLGGRSRPRGSASGSAFR